MDAASEEEFDQFMRGRWPAMVRLAYGLTGDTGHAEDLAQAAFARAYASWGRVQRAGNPEAYVRRIVVNANRSRFRRRRVSEELRADLGDHLAAGQPGPGDSGPEHGDLLAALDRLGPRQRAVIVLRYWLDLSESETAAALHCSVGTVKSQASRALATLRKAGLNSDGTLRNQDTRDQDTRDQNTVEGGLR